MFRSSHELKREGKKNMPKKRHYLHKSLTPHFQTLSSRQPIRSTANIISWAINSTKKLNIGNPACEPSIIILDGKTQVLLGLQIKTRKK